MNLNQWFRGIRFKFLILLFIPTVAIVSLFLGSYFSSNKLGDSLRQANSQDVPSALSLSAMNSGLMTLTVQLYLATSSSDPGTAAEAISRAKTEYKNFEAEIEEFKQYEMSDEEKANFAKFESAWKKQKELIDNVFTLISKFERAPAVDLLNGPYGENLAVLDQVFTTFDEIQTHSSERNQVAADSLIRTSQMTMLAVGAISLALILVIGFMTVVNVVSNLTSMSKSLSDSSAEVNSAAANISKSADDLSSAATEQSASLEQTASAVQQVSSMVARNAESAQSSSQTSELSLNKANQGSEAVEKMIAAMRDISNGNQAIVTQIEQSNAQFANIVTVIQEIGSKTKVINDIVFQTKLLSFNASVEAARAGESGKGFAVVAEEVGNLAQMSGSAAKEISDMLGESIRRVETIVNESKSRLEGLVVEGKSKMEVGTQIAGQCGDVLLEIVEQNGRVSSLSRDISSASREQATGIEEISKAVTQLNEVTQISSSTSEQAASAASQLQAQTSALDSVVDRLAILIEGSSKRAA